MHSSKEHSYHQPTTSQKQWVHKQLKKMGISNWKFTDLMADASFRAYSRIIHPEGSFILMHFPPEKEDGKRIVESSKFLLANKVQVPRLYSYDTKLGVLLQQDLGKELLAHRNLQSIEPDLYKKALVQLKLIQKTDASSFGYLGEDKLMEEMELFSKWFVNDWLNATKDKSVQKLEKLYLYITKNILAAPQCCVHMDFHSRNLCIVKNTKPTPLMAKDIKANKLNQDKDEHIGILDYQDILQGHFCYDIWSLLRDAYALLPQSIFNILYDECIDYATTKFNLDYKEFTKSQFNLIGIQRCLKVCGIFARLSLRDNKTSYLQYIPLVMDYLIEAINNLTGYQEQSKNIIVANKLLVVNTLTHLKQKAQNKLAN